MSLAHIHLRFGRNTFHDLEHRVPGEAYLGSDKISLPWQVDSFGLTSSHDNPASDCQMRWLISILFRLPGAKSIVSIIDWLFFFGYLFQKEQSMYSRMSEISPP
jgi:hypothetical protein